MVAHFTFPLPSRIHQRRSYPLQIRGDRGVENLSFVFIEIGCKHNKKRGELKNKKELFLKYWGDTYRSSGKVDWVPKVFKVISHYNFLDRFPVKYNKYSVDAIMHHKEISSDMLASFTQDDIYEIKRVVRKRSDQDIIDDLIRRKDASGLQQLILYADEQNKLSTLRGKMAEFISQKTIDSVFDKTQMVQYKNGHIKYFNKRFKGEAEVDQVLQFYGEQPFYDMVDKLSQMDSIEVFSDTPSINRYINKAG